MILIRRDRDLPVAVLQARELAPAGDTGGSRMVISLESLDRRTGIIVHELTHQFAFDIVPGTSRDAPVLIEGLAEHQRGRWEEADLHRARVASAAGFIPSVAGLADSDRHLAHAVFDFVSDRYGAEGIRQLLFALRAHPTVEQALAMAFGMTLAQFDRSFRGYVTARFGQP